jgi:hypothetical protein
MYSGVKKIFGVYWLAYGGACALLQSAYLHAAIVLLAMTFPLWAKGGAWWEVPISSLPTMLGFTVAALAVFIGFGDEDYRALLAQPDEADKSGFSIYVSLCTTFVHFIIVQALAFSFAIVASSWKAVAPPEWLVPFVIIGCGLGFFLFLYAVTSIVAVTMHIYRISQMYSAYHAIKSKSANL